MHHPFLMGAAWHLTTRSIKNPQNSGKGPQRRLVTEQALAEVLARHEKKLLLVDGLPEEGPGTETGMLLGRFGMGVLVSLPKIDSVLGRVIFSESLFMCKEIHSNAENTSPCLSTADSLTLCPYFSRCYTLAHSTGSRCPYTLSFPSESSDPPHPQHVYHTILKNNLGNIKKVKQFEN